VARAGERPGPGPTDLGSGGETIQSRTVTQPSAGQYTSSPRAGGWARRRGVDGVLERVAADRVLADGKLDTTLAAGVQTETISISTPRERAVTFNYTSGTLRMDDIDGASGRLRNARRISSAEHRDGAAKRRPAGFRNYAWA